jgi:phosphohistidine phosphatase
MKTLLLLRHAKSSWKDDSLPDHDRPLNKRGQRDAPRVGSLMKKEGLLPDLILCSSAVRAKTTLDLVTEALGYNAEIEYRDDLYAFEPGPYLNALAQVPESFDLVMIVGHNPALEQLLVGITSEYLRLPTAALAEVELPIDDWSQISFGMGARLINLWHPKAFKS